MSVLGDINQRLDALFDSAGEPCGKGWISKGETCHAGKGATPNPKQRPASQAGVMRPLNRDADFKAVMQRQKQIESVVSRLENSPAFKVDDSDIFSPSAQGRLGALTALRDAKNPRVGVVGVTDKNGDYAGFVSYKPGRGEIEIENFGTNQSEKGLGRKLFDKLLDEAHAQGAGLSAASVEESVGFYEKMGMKREGSNAMYMSADDVKRAVANRAKRTDGYFSFHLDSDTHTPKEKRQRKIRKVMREFKEGELMIGRSDKPVKSRKQAIAIALNSKLDSMGYIRFDFSGDEITLQPLTVRPSCSECLEKHLGAAMVLLAEAETDYPEHRLLAIGHLHEAEEESRAAWPEISLAIRQMRKDLQQQNITPDFYELARLLQFEDGVEDEPVVVAINRMDAAGVEHLDRNCLKPEDKDSAGKRCGKRASAAEGKLTSIDPSGKRIIDKVKARKVAQAIRERKYGGKASTTQPKNVQPKKPTVASHDDTVIPKKFSSFLGKANGFYYHDAPSNLDIPGRIFKSSPSGNVARWEMTEEEHRSYSQKTYGTNNPMKGRKVSVNTKEQIENFAEKTGMSLDAVENSFTAIQDWSNEGYEEIRKVQAGKTKSKKLKAEYQPKIDAINQFIEKAPKYEGQISRGLSFKTAKERDAFLKALDDGDYFEPKALSSWTSSSKVASGFAQGRFGVVLVTSNKTGASIRNVSDYGADEDEVIVPKGVRYELDGRRKTRDDGVIVVGLTDKGISRKRLDSQAFNPSPLGASKTNRKRSRKQNINIKKFIESPDMLKIVSKSHRSDSFIYLDRNPYRDQVGKFASKVGVVASPVASWAAGKVVGGALASVAAAHGIDPGMAQHISESAVQALATVGQKTFSKPTTAKQFAKDFVIESAAVFAGKMPYTGFDDAVLGGDNEVADVLSLAIANRSNIGAVLNGMSKEVTTVGKLLKRKGLRMDAVDWDDLNQDELEALFKLSLVGAVMSGERLDASDRTKRFIDWNGLRIGLTHEPGDKRHGRKLTAAYGYVRGTYGQAEDGMALDVWVGPELGSSAFSARQIWKINQLTFQGDFDESKYVIGVKSKQEAEDLYKENMPAQLFGGIARATIEELAPTRRDSFITVDEANAGFERMRDDVYAKYKATVNMSASELEEWAETDASKQASLTRSPIKRNLRLLSKPKSEWDAKDVRDANRTISFVSRMKRASQGEADAETGYSKRDVSLKNWAFDPTKERGDSLLRNDILTDWQTDMNPTPPSINGYIYLDAAGKPCGKGWISASYNCSGDKRAYTKQHRQGDRDKAAQRIRDERRKAKGYREEVKTIDDFVKNVDVLQDEISARLANLEYDYDQTDPQPKNKRTAPLNPADETDPKKRAFRLKAQEDAKRFKKELDDFDATYGVKNGNDNALMRKDPEAWKKRQALKASYEAESGKASGKIEDDLSLDDIKAQEKEMLRGLDVMEQSAKNMGVWDQVNQKEFKQLREDLRQQIKNSDEISTDLSSQEEISKQRKQQQQAQKQAEKRRKAAERKAKAADKKIGQIEKKMAGTGRKKLSVNDELKLADEKFRTQSERQSALEGIIQATLAQQEAQQVGGKSSVVPFSGQSMRDRRNLEFQLREELFKLTDLGIDFRSEASTRAFKAKKAELDRKLAETQEKFRQMDIERLNIMWNKKSPKDRKLDSLIQYAADCKSRFDSRYPSRQIAIPINTSLLGYFDALSAMADGNLLAIGRYSVKRDRSIRRDSQGLGYDLVDGCFVLESGYQDKYIRI